MSLNTNTSTYWHSNLFMSQKSITNSQRKKLYKSRNFIKLLYFFIFIKFIIFLFLSHKMLRIHFLRHLNGFAISSIQKQVFFYEKNFYFAFYEKAFYLNNTQIYKINSDIKFKPRKRENVDIYNIVKLNTPSSSMIYK